jgi:hypothetical protein
MAGLENTHLIVILRLFVLKEQLQAFLPYLRLGVPASAMALGRRIVLAILL